MSHPGADVQRGAPHSSPVAPPAGVEDPCSGGKGGRYVRLSLFSLQWHSPEILCVMVAFNFSLREYLVSVV